MFSRVFLCAFLVVIVQLVHAQKQIICTPGTFKNPDWSTTTDSDFSRGIKPIRACVPCQIGTYQPLNDQTSCLKCDAGKTTESILAKTKTACSVTTVSGGCPAGTQFDKARAGESKDDACRDCSQGFANTEVGAICVQCSKGKYTTLATKATSCVACTGSLTTKAAGTYSEAGDGTDVCAEAVLAACEPGNFLNSDKSCAPCAVGTYNPSLTATSTCKACPDGKTTNPGKNGPSASIDSCIDGTTCPAGSFLKDSISTSADEVTFTCTKCKTGSFSAVANAKMCLPCERGYFAGPLAGSTACTKCVAGKTSIPGAAVCISGAAPCPAGSKLNSDNTCAVCPKGQFSTMPDSRECTKCPFGTYADSTGSTSCSNCLADNGIVNAKEGASACFSNFLESCEPGQHLNTDGICTDCAAGKFQPYRSFAPDCRSCPPGKYSDVVKASTCKVCKDQATVGATTCAAACPAGQYMPPGSTDTSACVSCPAGKFNVLNGQSGASACLNCPRNTYLDLVDVTSERSCYRCEKGKTSAPGSTKPTDCVAQVVKCASGEFAATVAVQDDNAKFNEAGKQCTTCPVGKFTSTEDASACTACAAGKSTLTTGTPNGNFCIASTVCDAGSFLNAEGRYMWCQKCGAGSYSAVVGATDASTCTKCPAGKRTNQPGQTAVSACVATDSNAACPAGTFAKTFGKKVSADTATAVARSVCLSCPPGTYGPNTGAESIADCIRCSPEYGSSFGSTSQSECVAFTAFEKPTDVCPPGTTREVEGSGFKCTKCPQGTYSDAINSECVSCPSETTSPIGSKSEKMCVAQSVGCPMGMYGSSSRGGNGGSDGCTACPPGSFLDYSGATVIDQCKKCPARLPSPAGSVSKRACGTTSNCPAGTYSKLRGSLFFCKKCPENTYSSAVDAGSVEACNLCPTDSVDNVEYTSPPGSTASTACVKGRVQPTMAPTMAVAEFDLGMYMTLNGVDKETFNGDIAYADAFAGAIESALFDPDEPANVYEITKVQADAKIGTTSRGRRLAAASAESKISFTVSVNGQAVSQENVGGILTANVNAGLFDTYLQMSASNTGATGMQNATAEDCDVTPTATSVPAGEEEVKKKGSIGAIIGAVAGVLVLGGIGYYFYSSKQEPVANRSNEKEFRDVQMTAVPTDSV